MPTSTNDEEYARLSAECRRHLKAGMLDWYAFDLKSMGALLGREYRYVDKLKVLMVAFYIDLSGVSKEPFIDPPLVDSIRCAARKSKMSKYQIDELYLATIRPDMTPRHCMNVKDSLYLLELCLTDRGDEAEAVLRNMAK